MNIRNLILTAGGALALATTAQADKLVIKGSDTLGAKLVPLLAENFKKSHPGVSFSIAAEGSSTGIAALIDGSTEIAMSSRRVKKKEISDAGGAGKTLTPTVVAWDGLAVIVNGSNGVGNLTKKQVEQIFTGDITDWSAVGGTPGPIAIYTRNTSSGTYSDFKELAMSKRDYAPNSQKMGGNEQIAAEVAKSKGGIGYVGLAYVKAKGVKVVSIDGKVPNASDIRSKSYPYSRQTYYYTNGSAKGLAKEFIDFSLSPEGQKIVNQIGFVSVK